MVQRGLRFVIEALLAEGTSETHVYRSHTGRRLTALRRERRSFVLQPLFAGDLIMCEKCRRVTLGPS